MQVKYIARSAGLPSGLNKTEMTLQRKQVGQHQLTNEKMTADRLTLLMSKRKMCLKY